MQLDYKALKVTHSYVDAEIVLNMCIIVMKGNIQNNLPYVLPIEREEKEKERKGRGKLTALYHVQ